jgi:alpha-amylase
VYKFEPHVLASNDEKLADDWRRLQTSDHFYYMCTKWFADGDVHAYFSPYASPYEAFAAYMSALKDLEIRVRSAAPS